MHYDHRRRPAQPPTPAADAFEVHRAEVQPGLSLAYVREGVGGTPLLLIHGYPETKRIWWRNIEPLAAAGFEVIAVDLRGAGDSDLSPDDTYDIAVYARDLYALVHDVLGHERCTIAASDVGGVVATDLSHRFDGFVDRLCVFNTVPPMCTDAYTAAGLDLAAIGGAASGSTSTGDYRWWQGRHPDELAAILTSDQARRLWVAGMYTSRLWGSPGGFTPADVDFMTEPFADEARIRAGWAVYQLGHGRETSELPMLFEPVTVETLLLYGPDDHVVPDDFVAFAEVAYPNRIGPLVVPGAGHFLQWERADVFNRLLAATFGPRRG